MIWTLVWAFLAPLAIAPDLLQTPNFGAIRDLFEVAAPITQPKPAAVPSLLLTAMAEPTVGQPPQNLLFIPLCAWITCMAAYAMAALKTGEYCVYGVNLCAWAISAGISALLLWAGAYLAFHTNALWLAIAGPVWVLSAEMLRSTVYVALRKDALRTDLDREWLARFNAMKLRTALLFAAVGTTTLVLPLFILDQPNTVWRWAVGVAGLLTGPTAAFIGSSARTAFMPQAKDKNSASWLSASVAVGGATLIFAVALFMLLGRLSALIITMPAMNWTSTGAGKDRLAALAITACAACLCVLAFAGLAFWIDRCVNLNRFSMHAVYRNRLVRAFLGTARKSVDRYPDRFTQFDPATTFAFVIHSMAARRRRRCSLSSTGR